MTITMPQSLAALTRDGRMLFAARVLRLFAYGFLAVILVIYLVAIGLTKTQVGILLTSTLIGDAVISLFLTTAADQFGRRRTLMIGAGLMVFAGILFVLTDNFVLLVIAATVGVISPSGYEIGPFLAVEQATLSQIVPDKVRTRVFAWYYLAGASAGAAGALASGWLVHVCGVSGMTLAQSYRIILTAYALIGLLLWILFARLSEGVEIAGPRQSPQHLTALFRKNFGLHRSRKTVLNLSALFALDSFAGAFILNSIVAYWFHVRFGADPKILGGIFFGASLLSGLSGLAAARLASRFGLINTMVFTHIPSNILLIFVPFMPNLGWAVAVFLLRCSISQMDVPTRQSYTMAVVSPDERSAAGGITNIARTIGASLAPMFTSFLMVNAAWLSVSFVISGGLKIVYDLLVYKGFRSLIPPEETQ